MTHLVSFCFVVMRSCVNSTKPTKQHIFFYFCLLSLFFNFCFNFVFCLYFCGLASLHLSALLLLHFTAKHFLPLHNIYLSADSDCVRKHTLCEWSGTETSKIEPTLNHCCLEVTRHSVPLPHRPCFAQHTLVPSLNYIRRDSAAHSSIFLRPGKVLVHSKVNHVRLSLSLSLAAPPWLANRECKVDAVSASVGLKLFSTKFFAIHHAPCDHL